MTIPSGADELRLQRLIIREILIHIIREDPADEFLKNLKEVESNIISRQCFGYYCSMAGCIFTTDRHKKYINHLRRVHFINKNFLCNFKKKCKQLFRNLDTLVDHVQHIHQKNCNVDSVSNLPIVGSVQCSLVSCGRKQFPSLKKLMVHYHSKDHALERRICIFEGCQKVFHPLETNGRLHFYRKHMQLNNLALKRDCLIEPGDQIDHNLNLEPPHIDNEVDVSQDALFEDVSDQSDTEIENQQLDEIGFLKEFANFC